MYLIVESHYMYIICYKLIDGDRTFNTISYFEISIIRQDSEHLEETQ